jgi:hypothetical protein
MNNKIFENRFWSYVDKRNNIEECWNWLKCKTSNGYGQIWINGKMENSHRIAWILTFGEIPKGLFICHHCDNKLCCNPNHLFLGTPKDNTQDYIKKGKKIVSEEQKIKASISNKGKHNIKHTQETKNKISKIVKEWWKNKK